MMTIVIITIAIALLFDFMNGMNDAANSIATIVSTKVLSPLVAVAWAAFFNFAAVFIFGVHVATTIGKGIVDTTYVNEYLILSALIGAIVWVFFCSRNGIPISVSHALIGGLIGPALIRGGVGALVSTGIIKVAIFIALSPILGLILSYFLMTLTLTIYRKKSPQNVDSHFRIMQLFSSAVFSLGHGCNDAQKTMGIITILLYSTGYLTGEFHIPTWVIFSAYSAIALGTLTGGWRNVKTLGVGVTHLRPVGGFCAETAGAIAIIGSSLLGAPVSTTHTITGSIIGVGVTKRFSAVRWKLASNIVTAWIITIPSTLIVSSGIYWIISLFI